MAISLYNEQHYVNKAWAKQAEEALERLYNARGYFNRNSPLSVCKGILKEASLMGTNTPVQQYVFIALQVPRLRGDYEAALNMAIEKQRLYIKELQNSEG